MSFGQIAPLVYPKGYEKTAFEIETLPLKVTSKDPILERHYMVTAVQAILAELGIYDRKITGIYDDYTKTVIIKLQEMLGLNRTGKVGIAEWRAIRYPRFLKAQLMAAGRTYPFRHIENLIGAVDRLKLGSAPWIRPEVDVRLFKGKTLDEIRKIVEKPPWWMWAIIPIVPIVGLGIYMDIKKG